MEPQSALVLCAVLACIAGPATAAIIMLSVLSAVRKVAGEHFANQAAGQSANVEVAMRKLTMEERRFDLEQHERELALEVKREQFVRSGGGGRHLNVER